MAGCKFSASQRKTVIEHLRKKHNSVFPTGYFGSYDLHRCVPCQQVFIGATGLSGHHGKSEACCPHPTPTHASNTANSSTPVQPPNSRTRFMQPLPPAAPIQRDANSLFSNGRERPVLRISSTALLPFRNALIRILGIISNEMILHPEGQALTNAVCALMLLPSLVYDAKQKHTKNPSHLATQFNSIANTIDPIQEVLSLYATRAASRESISVQHTHPTLRKHESKKHASLQRSEAKTLKKACDLTVEGRPGKAVQLLEQIGSNGPISNELARSPSNIASIEALHPKARPQDSLPLPLRNESAALQISQEQLAIGFENLPVGSASALSGWTYDLLKQLTCRNDETQLAILAVFNLILQGKGGSPTLWTISRLCLIPKPDGGIRPIAIGDVWLRALNRIVNSIIAPAVGPSLAPFQYGVGVKGGAEIVSHLCQGSQHYMEARDADTIPWDTDFDDKSDPISMAALDYSNAFNTMFRSTILEGVVEHCPSITQLYRWSYGSIAILCLSDGLPICTSETGVRQGDPLGPLLYCVGFHPVLVELKRKFPRVTVAAYIDDDTLIGPRGQIIKALAFLEAKLATIGQHCNLAKSVLLDPSHRDASDPAPFSPIPVTSVGMKLLGGPLGQSCSGPLGSESYVSNFLTKHIGAKAKVLPHLDKLPPDIAFCLLRTCVNTRPMYLTRILAPWLTESISKSFDILVDNSLSVITGFKADLPPLSQAVRGLPLHLGGASVRRLLDSRECAYSASFLAACPHIRSCHNWIWHLMTGTGTDFHRLQQLLFKSTIPNYQDFSEHSGLTTSLPLDHVDEEIIHPLGRGISTRGKAKAKADTRMLILQTRADSNFNDLCERVNSSSSSFSLPNPNPTTLVMPIDEAVSDDDEPLPPPNDFSQKSLQLLKDKVLFANVLAMIPDKSSYKAWFRGGCGKGNAPWLLHSAIGRGIMHLKPEEFAENLRLRLLLPIFNLASSNASWSCNCGTRLYALQNGFDDHHALGCRNLVLAKCERHTSLKEFLTKQFAALLGNSGTVGAHEVDITGPLGNVKRTDISITCGPNIWHIDLSITNNGCQLARSNKSCDKVGAAARSREKSKTTAWSKVFTATELARNFVPFVIECGGHLGDRAVDLIDKLSKLDRLCHIPDHKIASTRRNLQSGISTIIARYNAKLMRQFRNKCSLTLLHENSQPRPFIPSNDTGDLLSDDGIDDSPATAAILESQPSASQSTSHFRPSIPTHSRRRSLDETVYNCKTCNQESCQCPYVNSTTHSGSLHPTDPAENFFISLPAYLSLSEPEPNPTATPFDQLTHQQHFQSAESNNNSHPFEDYADEFPSDPTPASPTTPITHAPPMPGPSYHPDRCNFPLCARPNHTSTSPLSPCQHCDAPFCVSHIHIHEEFQCIRIGSPSSPSLYTQGDPSNQPGDAFSIDPNLDSNELLKMRLFSSSNFHSINDASPTGPSPPASTPNQVLAPPTVPAPRHIPTYFLVAYTDGSKRRHLQRAGWSTVIVKRDTHLDRQHEHRGVVLVEQYGPVVTNASSPYFLGAESNTNNTAELSAIAEALLWFIHYRPSPALNLAIITDSQLCITFLEGRAEPYKNIALVNRCRELLSLCKSSVPGTSVWFHHISSHTKNHWNDLADKHANLGALRRTSLGRYAPPPIVSAPSPTSGSATTVDPLTQLTNSMSRVRLEAAIAPSGTSDSVVESNAVQISNGCDGANFNPSPN